MTVACVTVSEDFHHCSFNCDFFYCLQLADFGLSAVFSHGQLLKTYCGSPLYASPEIVNGRPYQGPEVIIFTFFSVILLVSCVLTKVSFAVDF